MFYSFFLVLILLFSFSYDYLLISIEPTHLSLLTENQILMKRSLSIAKLYVLPEGEDIKNITDEVCYRSDLSQSQKENMIRYNRQIILFEYPSDGLKVKGIISFSPHAENQPLLIFLRGGNQLFGLLDPASDLLSYKDYTTITTTYRDGVSEGKDEFGGTDVNDIKNLIDFIPTLTKKLNIHLNPRNVFMIGGSRGGFEMFLALARYPELQNQVDKVVALSSVLDLRQWLKERPDMLQTLNQQFGLNLPNAQEWLNQRDPLLTIPYLQTCLPILILQGTEDNRVSLEQGRRMAKQLEGCGKSVTYWEIAGGKHTLYNISNRMDLIVGWLELH